jgi:uncharacterized protein YdaL
MNLTAVRRIRILLAVAFAFSVAAGVATAGRDIKPPKPGNPYPTAAGRVGGSVSSTGAAKVPSTSAPVTQGAGAPGNVGAKTLVLYDTTGPYGWLGELYAMTTANLASHFGSWTSEPVAQYQAGQISQYTATIYIGSTYDEPLPAAFLSDVFNATRPVVWIYNNIWELTNRYGDAFNLKFGFQWKQYDTSRVSHVAYKGTTVDRDGADNGGGIMDYWSVDPGKATVLAEAVRDSDGSRFPWALRASNLTYIGENPFVYTSEADRILVFEDLLFSVLDPSAPTRHRALVRLEDINPSYDPAELKAAADYLYSQGIAYGFGVSPVYTDPLGYYSPDHTPESSALSDRNSGVADMVKYMQAHGGTLIMHGYTHQYSNVANPYDGVTGDDFEFYRVTENADHTLNFRGPTAEDSAAWAGKKIDDSFREFKRAKIDAPTIFEFPHYAGSVVDYQTVAKSFSTRWERSLYFSGIMRGGTIDYSHLIGQTFPYVVRDVYGSVVLPENVGCYAPEAFFQFAPRFVSDILYAADKARVIRDGFASVYFHPFEGVGPLSQIIEGLRAQGWTFASPAQVAQTG